MTNPENPISLEDAIELYKNSNPQLSRWLQQLHDVRDIIENVPIYEEYKETHKSKNYKGCTCFVSGCNNPAEYEVGDARYPCGMCEEHAGIRDDYKAYIWSKMRYIRNAVHPHFSEFRTSK